MMPIFNYRAMSIDHTVVEGACDAANRQAALVILAEQGLKPVSLTERKERITRVDLATALRGAFGSEPKVSARELETFTRQLASLLGAGVPLAKALHHLAEETSSPRAKAQWKAIYGLVVEGASLADAMKHYPRTFPRVYCAMIHAGETGGFLALVLEQIADFQSNEKELRGKMVSALVYPAVLALLCVGVVAFLLVYFIPKFESIFSDFGAKLPTLTRIIVGTSNALTTHGIWVLVALALAAIFTARWVKTDSGDRKWQEWALRAPLLGPLTARFAMTRFCRMLGTLTHAGVPLINALTVARESLGNRILVDAVRDSIQNVQKGSRLADSLANCPELFPKSVLEIISVSEEAGRLEEELVRLAEVTEKELDRRLRMTLALAEPMMMFIMAGIVGVIVIGMVLPIFELQEYIK